MNLSELRTFLAVIETGSLVRASQRLNVTQSTVTARLQALEAELGQTLLNRHKSGAVLTPAGVRLHRYAATITDLWGQARRETALPGGLHSVCNIACEHDLWPALGERFFGYLRRHHRDVAVSVWQGSAAEIADWMATGKSDLAISYRAARGRREDLVTLKADRLILVSDRPDSPQRFDPGYVLVEAGEEFQRDHAAAFADADIARVSFNSAPSGLAHLLSAGGSAYLPDRMVRPHLRDRRLHALKDAPVFERPVYLVVNSDARAAWDWFDAAVAFSQA